LSENHFFEICRLPGKPAINGRTKSPHQTVASTPSSEFDYLPLA
jgi:hypothetical protein